jgi:hypothetical protein
MKKVWATLIFLFVFASCDTGVNVTNVPSDKLLFVDGRISPQDSLLKVYVFRALGLSERIPSHLLIESKAQVTISDGRREAILNYSPRTLQYEGINIFSDATDGTRFTLVVATPDGIKVTAHSTLPPKPKLISFKYTYVNKVLKYTVDWENPNGHKYFQAWMGLHGLVKSGQGSTELIKYRTDLPLEPEVFFWDRQPTGRNSISDSIVIFFDLAAPAKVSFTLANMEESIWSYQKTSDMYESWLSNAEESSIIPIFREPAQVYNNIIGGFGIFASYNCTDSLRLTIEP